MTQLIAEDLCKEFPTRGRPLVVLRHFSLTIASGENLAIVGPSGSGKSTLLSILGTLLPPSSGRIALDGQDPFALPEPQLAAFRNGRIGFVFQEHYLLPQCSVLENVLTPTIAAGATRTKDVARARMLLDRVGLGDRLEHRPAELSGGERQRAAVARALVRRPDLLLADEPTGNLDRAAADQVGRLLLELQRDEAMILIVVTHSQRLAAMMGRQVELGRD
jgi:lipoprotein-releasing system ATP-binding protein